MAVRIGLLGVSRIAEDAMVGPAGRTSGVTIEAVASRTAERAQQAAKTWGIPHWFSSYDDLLHSSVVDAVYISTPVALHRPWVIAALHNGKHVLCEKPLAANHDDAIAIAVAAAETPFVVMEAMHWRHHPMVALMRNVLDAGQLGAVRRVEARFLVPGEAVPAGDIRWNLGLGGGALMDVGVYPLSWACWVAGDRPRVLRAAAECPIAGVDGRMEIDLKWASGVTGRIGCSMIWPGPQSIAELVVQGERGEMKAVNPLAPQHGASIILNADGKRSVTDVPSESTYDHQLHVFRDAVNRGDLFPTTVAAAVRTMAVVDECYRRAGLLPRPAQH